MRGAGPLSPNGFKRPRFWALKLASERTQCWQKQDPSRSRTLADDWLAQFERALAEPGTAALGALFHPDSHWRDLLALTWTIATVDGRDAIAEALKAQAGRAKPSGFRIDPDRTAPRHGDPRGHRGDRSDLPVRNRARPRQRRCCGSSPDGDGGAPKAWTLLTALDELKGHEETVGRARPTGQSYSRDFRGPNWLDLRKSAAAYADSDPAVLVVGAGQAGLSIAARLKQLQVDTLIVDRWPRIGDNWRKRYHALTLHNQVQVNHLPYMNFPPNWPTYIPKDKLAAWFEAYAESMELNFWSGTEFESGAYDEKAGRWSVVLRRADGTKREMHPRHVVMATGLSGVPDRSGYPDAARISAARSCTPPNTKTAKPGRASARSSSAPATAAMTSRRICIRAAPSRRSCSAARPWWSTSSRARSCPMRSTTKARRWRTATSSPRRSRCRWRGKVTCC